MTWGRYWFRRIGIPQCRLMVELVDGQEIVDAGRPLVLAPGWFGVRWRRMDNGFELLMV